MLPVSTAAAYFFGGNMEADEALSLGVCLRSWDKTPKYLFQARFRTPCPTDEQWTLLPLDARPQFSVGENLWTFAFRNGEDVEKGAVKLATRIHASLKAYDVRAVDVYELRTDSNGLRYYHYLQAATA
ncbi:MAG: hypothetical protein GC134_05625 [Proteobacteria bacterium]|nr:hypothetical protein [Pseudomonadota bacterium]